LLNWLAEVTACSLLHTLGHIWAYFSLVAVVFGFKAVVLSGLLSLTCLYAIQFGFLLFLAGL
jgi:hypothetical protein